MTHRVETIGIRLYEHFSELGVEPAIQRARDWDYTADTLHAPFGYRRPTWQDGKGSVAFCPLLIEQTTRHLSDVDLNKYLDCVEVQLGYYIINRDMADDQASEWFDNFLGDEFPGSLEILNEVQMSWLDRKASQQ